MHHARPNRLRRAVAFAALAALLGVVALVLSQCTMVGDSLTGVNLEKNARSNCVNGCNDSYKAAIEQAKKDCGGTGNACFDAAQAAAFAAKTDCNNNCHKQGAGSAG